MEKQLFFVVNNVLALLFSSIIASRTFRNRSQELVYLGISILFPSVILLTILGLGVFDALYNYSVTLVLLLLILPVLAKSRFSSRINFLLSRQHIRPFLLATLLLLIGILSGYIAGRYVFTGTHFCFDDFSYHATAAGHWVKDHSIWSGPFSYHYHNPMNAEVLSLWWMLPFEQDGFAFLTGLYWLFLTSLSLFILCGRLGISLWIRFVILVVAFTSNIFFGQASTTFSGVDLAGPAMILASLAFLSFHNTENKKSDWSVFLFSGLACGYAVGCKVPFATIAFLLVLWVFLCRPKESPWSDRLKDSLLFCLGVFLTGFFWYGRNIYLAGNPVFPGQLGPLAGPLTSDIQYSTKIIGLLIDSGFRLQLVCDLFLRHLRWPFSMGMLSLMGYLGSGVWLVFGKHVNKSEVRSLSLLILAGIVMFLTYINMPFSARFNSPDAPMQLSLRFIIGPFLIGAILYSALMNLPGKIKYAFTTLFFVAIAAALIEAGFWFTYVAAVILVVLAVTVKFTSLPRFWGQKKTVYVLLLLFGALWGLGMTFPYQQKRTDRYVFQYKTGQDSNGLSWKQIDALPAGTTLSALGPNSYLLYPLLGRRLQHNYRVLNQVGMEPERLYKRYLNDSEHTKWWPEKNKVISNPQYYLQNANRGGTDCFLVIRNKDGTWPIMPHDFINAGWNCKWEDGDLMIWQQSRVPLLQDH